MREGLPIIRRTDLSLLALSFLLVSCSANSIPGQARAQEGALDIRPLFTESYSGIDTALRVVVKEPDRWRELWAQVAGQRTPAPPIPAVDFAEEMVLVAAMGRRGTGGYSIAIDRVQRDDEAIVATVVETSPGPGCMLTQALTAPVTAVKLPRSDLPVRYVEERQTRDCD